MKAWRRVAVALGTMLGCLVFLGGWALWNRQDLKWLAAPEVAPVPRTKAEPTAPPATRPPAPVPLAPPPERVLSMDGLQVRPYEGENRLDPGVLTAVNLLKGDLEGAVKDLKDATGLFPTAEDKLTVVPVSLDLCTFTEPFSLDDPGTGLRATLPVEPLVLKWWPAREVLSAALAEAILVQEAPGFASAPSWLRYGIVLHLSGFGPSYARRVLLETDRPPLQLVRPLGEAENLVWADGYWAVRAFAARRGDEAVKAWVEAMRTGLSWREALARTAGEHPGEFQEAYKRWTTAYFAERCANRPLLMDAVALLRQSKEEAAIPILDAFVKEHPLDLYAGDAAYFLNYARFRTGLYDAAVNGFTDLLVNYPGTTCRQAKAHYFLGRSYQLSGYPPLALGEFRLAALSPNPLLRKLALRRLKEVS